MEITPTLVGSIGLVASVPLTTARPTRIGHDTTIGENPAGEQWPRRAASGTQTPNPKTPSGPTSPGDRTGDRAAVVSPLILPPQPLAALRGDLVDGGGAVPACLGCF